MIIKRSARWIYLAVMFTVLIMSWEYQKTNPALAAGPIPEEAIRLRILANSDGPRDQWIKQQVRDRIMKHMNAWAVKPATIEDARKEIRAHLDELERIVGEELERLGVDERYTVFYGETSFPAKLYGTRMYPAGEYEALVVTIGDGEGRNWWCVLFPPLCFVGAAASGEADSGEKTQDAAKADSEAGSAQSGQEDGEKDDEVEVRFFLAELFEELKGMLGEWFS